MKRLWVLAMATILWVGCHTTTKSEAQSTGQAQSGSTQVNGPASGNLPASQTASSEVAQIAFNTTEHDFGRIREGEKVSYRFKFKNTGRVPLKITDVKPSCGCTASDYTREPVPPGGEGFVEVAFDSQGRTGTQQKTVTVYANTDPAAHVLRFKGEVIPANQ